MKQLPSREAKVPFAGQIEAFAAPNTTATNAAFGTITATANLVRTIQVAGKIVF